MAPIYLGKMVVPSSLRYIENLALAMAICILYKTTKLIVSLTSLAPPHLCTSLKWEKKKCPKLWRAILIRNISPNLASH